MLDTFLNSKNVHKTYKFSIYNNSHIGFIYTLFGPNYSPLSFCRKKRTLHFQVNVKLAYKQN